MTTQAIGLKLKLYTHCLNYINSCIDNAQLAINDAMQSSNNETKSSAGDKHETGRALLQLEQEKNTKQLSETLALKEKLLKINPELTATVIGVGSIVLTKDTNFYIATAAGKIEVEGISYYAISPASPIALKLLGLKSTDQFEFNGKLYQILTVL